MKDRDDLGAGMARSRELPAVHMPQQTYQWNFRVKPPEPEYLPWPTPAVSGPLAPPPPEPEPVPVAEPQATRRRIFRR